MPARRTTAAGVFIFGPAIRATDGGARLRNNPVFCATGRSMAKPDEAVPDPSGRNAAIDLLRGLSILLVVMHHVALRIPLRDGALQTLLARSLLGALSYNGHRAY
jgi:hypothetical protein